MMTDSDARRQKLPPLVRKRATVVHPPDDDGRVLLRQLRRTGIVAELIWPAPAQLPERTEIACVLIDREQISNATRLMEGFEGVALAIIDSESPLFLEVLASCSIHGVLIKPLRHFGILAQLIVATSLHGYGERLRSRIDHIEDNLRTRRIIEKATYALVIDKGLTPDAAYEMLRTEAMARRMTIGGVADCLVNERASREQQLAISGESTGSKKASR